jgi:hypothetical protein
VGGSGRGAFPSALGDRWTIGGWETAAPWARAATVKSESRPRAAAAEQFSMDNADFVLLLRRMSQPETKFTSPVSLVVDAVLVIGFFLFIFRIVAPHVPSNDRSMIVLWGGLTAACMSGVFWLAVQMFRVVLRAQREDRRS